MTDEIAQGREPERSPFGSGHRRTWLMTGFVLVLLVVVFAVGVHRGSTPAPPPSSSPAPTASTTTDPGPPLVLGASRCVRLDGDELTVAFGVHNLGPDPLVVHELAATFPLGGLTPDPSAAPDAGCPITPIPTVLAAGEDAVLGFVLTAGDPRCLAPLPVVVHVDYDVSGQGSMGQDLQAFPDLGSYDLPGDCGSPGG